MVCALRGGEGAVFSAINLKKNLAFRYAGAERKGESERWSW